MAEAEENLNHASCITGSDRDRATGEPTSAARQADMKQAIELARKGELAVAEGLFRKQLACGAAPALLHNLAVCLIQRNQTVEAREHLAHALRLDPQYSRAHHSLGRTLHRERQFGPAEGHLRQAVAIEPANAEVLSDLGSLLNDLRRYEEAEVWLRQAVRIRPDSTAVHNNLGVALTGLGDLDAACDILRRALDVQPHDAAAQTNLGNAFKAQGRLAAALACYDLALAIDPQCVTARWNRALALLESGDFQRGWEEYEWRWRRPQTPPRQFPQPCWAGEPLTGRTLLLHAEQGLGDTLQFIRYAAVVKKAGAKVVFECPQPLVQVLKQVAGVDMLVPEGAALPAFDVHAPLLSLPRLCGTTPAAIPAVVPYLHPEIRSVADWAARLAPLVPPEDYRVGLVWQGNPHHHWDRFRSIALNEFRRLAGMDAITFLSLQRGPGAEQVGSLSGRARDLHLVSPWPEADAAKTDIADAAAIMRNLDLVITVDTATAHLAGALGIKVWILIGAISDWRWMQGRGDSPWYPTARLFRQRRLGRWGPVLHDIRAELARQARIHRHGATQAKEAGQ